MTNRVVTKALAGLQDLLLGTGSVTQARASGDVQVNKIDASGLPYENAESLRTKIGKKIEALTNVAAMQALVTATSEEKYVYLLGYTTAGDGGGGLFYLDTTDITSAEDLNLIFNPDTPASGRWKRIDTSKQLSPDNGDADLVITDYDEGIQLFATTLTADRTVTLPSSGLFKGKVSKVLRLDTALFTLNVGGIKTIPEGESALVEVTYDGTTWILTSYVVLVSGGALTVESLSSSLSFLLHPDSFKGHRELYSQKISPFFFNQNWGGPNFGGGPDDNLLEIHTAQIMGLADVNHSLVLGDNAARSYHAQGFKVGLATTLTNIILSIVKTGLPLDNLQLSIYDDSATVPNAVITNGIATVVNGKEIATITSPNNGDTFGGTYVTFTFPTPPVLAANTQYHLILSRSGAADAGSFYNILSDKDFLAYPNNLCHVADATPTWSSATTTDSILFYIIISDKYMQNGGLFNEGKLIGYEASPLNQSAALKVPLKHTFSSAKGTIHIAGANFTKNKTFLDIGVSVDRNRFVLRCNITTGYAQLTIYEDDTTIHSLIGSTDISSGEHIIDLIYRTNNDGNDFLYLYIDGVNEGELTTLSISLASYIVSRGHCSIGAGDPLTPVWTEDLVFSSLPSLSGWTWTGAATEAICMYTNNNILYQTAGGFGTDLGYYVKNLALDNSIGWVLEVDFILTGFNSGTFFDKNIIHIFDGDRHLTINVQPRGINFIPEGKSTALLRYVSVELDRKITLKIVCKDNDFYASINNELVYDGTGELITPNATNAIYFGDTGGSSVNDEVGINWSRLRYYAGAHLPQISSAEISEVAFWSEDKRAFLNSIYNSGAIRSVKQLAQVKENFISKQTKKTNIAAIGLNYSVSSGEWTPVHNFNLFTLGEEISLSYSTSMETTGTGVGFLLASVGLAISPRKEQDFPTLGIIEEVSFSYLFRPLFGLSHANIWVTEAAGTITNFNDTLTIEET